MRVTSDGGLFLVRELDERLGFEELIQHLADSRRGRNTQFPFADLLRQPMYSRLAGYEDLNDAVAESHLTRRLFASMAGEVQGGHTNVFGGGTSVRPNLLTNLRTNLRCCASMIMSPFVLDRNVP